MCVCVCVVRLEIHVPSQNKNANLFQTTRGGGWTLISAQVVYHNIVLFRFCFPVGVFLTIPTSPNSTARRLLLQRQQLPCQSADQPHADRAAVLEHGHGTKCEKGGVE